VGPISRRSVITVSPDSGQLIVKPAICHSQYENRWSPIHAIGRYDSTSSSAVRRSNSTPPRAAAINAAWVRHTPFGLPVVPEV